MDNDKFMELVNLKKENIKLLENISDKLDKVAHETYETYQQAQEMRSLGELIEICLKKNDKRTCELLGIEYIVNSDNVVPRQMEELEKYDYGYHTNVKAIEKDEVEKKDFDDAETKNLNEFEKYDYEYHANVQTIEKDEVEKKDFDGAETSDYKDDGSNEFSVEKKNNYVSMLSEEQNKILSELNAKFEQQFNIVHEKLISKNNVFTKTGELAIKKELTRYRILRDRMNNCAGNINMLACDLKLCVEFEEELKFKMIIKECQVISPMQALLFGYKQFVYISSSKIKVDDNVILRDESKFIQMAISLNSLVDDLLKSLCIKKYLNEKEMTAKAYIKNLIQRISITGCSTNRYKWPRKIVTGLTKVDFRKIGDVTNW